MEMINTKVAGISFTDAAHFAELQPGVALRCVPEPNNPYDCNAVRVETTDGKKVGYITRKNNLAARVFDDIKQNKTVKCEVIQKTGGGEKTVGLNIKLTIGSG